jgi:hypothetical protein
MFLTWLCCLCGSHHGMLFLLSTCLHIMICHPIICAMFVNLPYIIVFLLVLHALVLYGTNNALLVSAIVIPSSHNITAFLCYCNVDRFIPTITIMRYDYKHALNTIVGKLSIVGIFVNHEPTFEFAHRKFHTSCSSAPCIFAYHSKSFDDTCKMHV